MDNKSNMADGVNSFDIKVGSEVVEFFNKNVSPYPTEVGGPKFDLVPVEKQKDIMLNIARLHAKQEYDRIMQLVSVLQTQAQQIKRRLDITDQVHAAYYQFQLYHDKCYWLAYDTLKNRSILCQNGPNGWFCGKPEEYDYLARVKWLGDHSWIEVDDSGNVIW